jgi:hypothetical protein
MAQQGVFPVMMPKGGVYQHGNMQYYPMSHPQDGVNPKSIQMNLKDQNQQENLKLNANVSLRFNYSNISIILY